MRSSHLLLLALCGCVALAAEAGREYHHHGDSGASGASTVHHHHDSTGSTSNGGAPSAVTSHHHSQLSHSAILGNSAQLAKIAALMYPSGPNTDGASYSDCARPHAPRPGFQSDAADGIARALGLQQSGGDAVTFFDLNAPAHKQFCHAAVAYVPASSLAAARLSPPDASRGVFVAAFRGSSNAAAALADVNFESAPHSIRGSSVEVHSGFWASLHGRPGPMTCNAAGKGPVPESCAAAVASFIDKLATKHGVTQPQVMVTGHSLGAAEAAMFALHLDAAGGYAVSAYTYGQPKIGRGRAWRSAYDGPNGLSKRTIRAVHGADPVPQLASTCQTKGSEAYEQVGTLLRVRDGKCPVDSPTGPHGKCLPAVAAGAFECTIEPESPEYDDCSIFVGKGPTGKYDMCFCKAMPVRLLGIKSKDGLWGDHQYNLYAAGLAGCQAGGGLAPSQPGALPPKSICKAYNTAELCSFS